MIKCSVCGGECWAGSSSGTCSGCLQAIIANSMVEEAGDEEDTTNCMDCDDVIDIGMSFSTGGFCASCSMKRDDNGGEPEDDEDGVFTEPEEGDLITSDHMKFYEFDATHKGPVVECRDGERWAHAVQAYMDDQKFYPNVWFISDHGNAHLINLAYEYRKEEE